MPSNNTDETCLTNPKVNQTEGARVMVVDDNIDLLKLMSMRLKLMKFDIKIATSGLEALSIMTLWMPDIIITDLQMPHLDGMEFFEKVHGQNPLLPVIILTAHGTIPDAVKATQSGVASFLTKPFDGDSLITEIQQVLLSSGFVKSIHLEDKIDRQEAPLKLHKITSKSPKMVALMQQVERLAQTNTIILLEGESGVGKDDIARTAHQLSLRADRPLLYLSGSALPDNLLAIELFGEVGNGSIENPDRYGILREAAGGSAILADFNEASRELVYKTLTALISKAAKPVDSEEQYSIDVRVIATTSIVGRYGDLGQVPWDFVNKLDFSTLSVPALRERREDVPLIANQYLASLDLDKELSFANKAMQLMLSAEWPGNVRQLISVVRQCARLCKTKVISESLVNSRLSNPVFQIQPLSNAHRDFERNYLTDVLKATNGNVTKASEMAKRNRTEFHRLLNKHKIEAKSFRQ